MGKEKDFELDVLLNYYKWRFWRRRKTAEVYYVLEFIETLDDQSVDAVAGVDSGDNECVNQGFSSRSDQWR